MGLDDAQVQLKNVTVLRQSEARVDAEIFLEAKGRDKCTVFE